VTATPLKPPPTIRMVGVISALIRV